MKAVWQGAAAAPSTSATNYTFITASLSTAWETVETVFTGVACVTPLSENITITKFTVWVTTAPGAGKSWAFTVRANQADTSASVTISNANTSASWSGSINLNQLDIVAFASVPTSTPTAPGNIYWTIEYTTGGNYYLIPGGFAGTNQTGVTMYFHPIRGSNADLQWGLTSSGREAVIPTAVTVTRFAVNVSIPPEIGTPGSYNDYYIRNATAGVDADFYVHLMGSSYNLSALSPAGSFSFSAGDRMVIKMFASPNSGWTRHMMCMTVVPSTTGEVINAAYGHSNAPSASATNYQELAGSNSWNATESSVYEKTGAGTIKNLYAWQTTAPGVGKSYAYTVRQSGGDSSLTTSVSGTNTTANDTTHSFAAADGDFISVKSVPSGTPSATGALSISYVLLVSQSGIASTVKGITSISGISSITL